MRFLSTLAFVSTCAWQTTTFADVRVVDFEDLSLASDSAAPADSTATPFTSHDVTFNRTWFDAGDGKCCAGAWAYSSKTDLQTPGPGNAYSAYVQPSGGGVDGSATYGVTTNFFRGDAQVAFPSPSKANGLYLANTTYAYHATINGDDGSEVPFVKGPFQDGDWFKLDIVGINQDGEDTGSVEFFLADFRNGQRKAIDQWTWVDLQPLGDSVAMLQFEMSSSDVGQFGMNTPAYFAIDNLTYQTSSVIGDFDGNGQLDAADLDALASAMSMGDLAFDLNEDGSVDLLDRTQWVVDIKQSWFGDSDLNGEFSSADLVQVFQSGQFETGRRAGWADGDWNGDLRFTSSDLVVAFQQGGFEVGPRLAVVHAVPEPCSRLLVWAAILAIHGWKRLMEGCRLK